MCQPLESLETFGSACSSDEHCVAGLFCIGMKCAQCDKDYTLPQNTLRGRLPSAEAVITSGNRAVSPDKGRCVNGRIVSRKVDNIRRRVELLQLVRNQRPRTEWEAIRDNTGIVCLVFCVLSLWVMFSSMHRSRCDTIRLAIEQERRLRSKRRSSGWTEKGPEPQGRKRTNTNDTTTTPLHQLQLLRGSHQHGVELTQPRQGRPYQIRHAPLPPPRPYPYPPISGRQNAHPPPVIMPMAMVPVPPPLCSSPSLDML